MNWIRLIMWLGERLSGPHSKEEAHNKYCGSVKSESNEIGLRV